MGRPSTADAVPDENALLHAGGRASGWGNLGLWPALDYASACEALADRVAQAVGPLRGVRVLSPGSGSGAELWRWTSRHGAAQAVGLDPSAPDALVRRPPAGRGQPRVLTLQADARQMSEVAGGGFDRVLCVDAAYHVAPRDRWLRQAHQALRPGGRLAFTDLTLAASGPLLQATRLLLAGPARAAGIAVSQLLPASAAVERLRRAGFDDVRVDVLDEAVLDGFVGFVRAQSRRLGRRAAGPGWRRVAATARLIPLARRLGLGYALFAARAVPPDEASATPAAPNPADGSGAGWAQARGRAVR